MGVAAAVGAVLAGGRVGPVAAATALTTWGGLFAATGIDPAQHPTPGLVFAGCQCLLVVLWAVALADVRRRGWPLHRVWMLGAGWLAPYALGPPLLSNDVYSYLAQGAMSAGGIDPSTAGPNALGPGSPLLAAVDVRWRGAPSPYGPLATIVERTIWSWSDGRPVIAVALFRLVAVLSVIGIAILVTALLRNRSPSRRATALMLTWVNPLLIFHVVAACHLDGLMALLILVAVGAGLRRGPGMLAVLAVAATAAAAVKIPALAVLAGPGSLLARDRAWRRLATVGGVGVVTWCALSVVAGEGGHWGRALSTPGQGHTLSAPDTMLADLLTPLRWAGLASGPTLLTTCRILAALTALAWCSRLMLTSQRRPPSTTCGLCLLTLALGAPVLYPWYLAWSVPCLALTVTGRNVARLALLSALAAIMTVQGLTRPETYALVITVITTALAWLRIHEHLWQRANPLGAPTRRAGGLSRVIGLSLARRRRAVTWLAAPAVDLLDHQRLLGRSAPAGSVAGMTPLSPTCRMLLTSGQR